MIKENPSSNIGFPNWWADHLLNQAQRLGDNVYTPNQVYDRVVLHNYPQEEAWVWRKAGLDVLKGLGVEVTIDPNRYGINGKDLAKTLSTTLKGMGLVRFTNFPVLREEEIDKLILTIGEKVVFGW